jgi:hypothetical protein
MAQQPSEQVQPSLERGAEVRQTSHRNTPSRSEISSSDSERLYGLLKQYKKDLIAEKKKTEG